MAISRTQTDSISDVELSKEDALSKKVKDQQASTQNKPEKVRLQKKPGFFASTISELKLVEWPGLRYVINWSLAIIAFTIVMSLILGFADHVFGAGISFANCSSPENTENRTVSDCSEEFVTKITFRD
jgi:preprotein translocase SecE subunit